MLYLETDPDDVHPDPAGDSSGAAGLVQHGHLHTGIRQAFRLTAVTSLLVSFLSKWKPASRVLLRRAASPARSCSSMAVWTGKRCSQERPETSAIMQ